MAILLWTLLKSKLILFFMISQTSVDSDISVSISSILLAANSDVIAEIVNNEVDYSSSCMNIWDL